MSTPEGLDEARAEQDNGDTQATKSSLINDKEPAKSGLAEPPKSKKRAREAVDAEREPGKSLLPFARVQKIIKADKEIPIVAKEATFLISVATEEFIKRLTEAGQHVAQREKRTTVQHRDLATVVRRADEFLFLEDILPWTSADPPAKRQKPGKAPSESSAAGGNQRKKDSTKGPTLLDHFGADKKDADEDIDDVVMNEDGTMYAGNPAEFEE